MIAILVKGGMVQEIYTDDREQADVGVVVRDFDAEAAGENGVGVWMPVYDPETVHEAETAIV